MATSRPPPKILFIHDGVPAGELVQYLTDSGLRLLDVDAADAVALAIEWQPDIIVLDFSADGEITSRLKNHDATRHIPIIALATLAGERKG